MPGTMRGPLWIGFILLLVLLCIEIVAPERVMDGFQTITSSGSGSDTLALNVGPSNSIFAQAFKRRSDVGPMGEASAGGKDGQGPNSSPKTGNAQFTADKRYFADYTDVQGIGVPNDYCRVVFPSGAKEAESCLSRGVGGSAGQSAVVYKTNPRTHGFLK
jgi:hypothetical protein